MKKGYLSQYFDGVAIKTLSAVEADRTRSNQHEYNATRDMLDFMGRPSEKTPLDARFLYLNDDDAEPVPEDAFLTLYDSRKGQSHRSAEYRFYFPTTNVSNNASEGDLLAIAKRRDGGLLVIIAERDSTIARQIRWLFGMTDTDHPGFSVKSEMETEQDRIGFAARIVLEQIGIQPEIDAPNFLDQMLGLFGGTFPTTLEFSAFARSTLTDVDAFVAPDTAVLVWMDREEVLFRTLEKHLLSEQMSVLFHDGTVDPDPVMKVAQSAFQRRKSRAGSALENHLEAVFKSQGVTYSRTAVTERKLKPDFIFPDIARYHDPSFPSALLTMLASKTTSKDRWRQILNEATRIPTKHLITLEPSISQNQTAEMQSEQVQLVIPAPLHDTYTAAQRTWLLDVSGFVDLVKARQGG
ncbi:MAG: restriction endonuclease [Betaproteobacteria bacterium]|nr:restriction endonuclease [Betaproteobacteria bacterium]